MSSCVGLHALITESCSYCSRISNCYYCRVCSLCHTVAGCIDAWEQPADSSHPNPYTGISIING